MARKGKPLSRSPAVASMVKAAEKGDVAEVKRLLAEGADPTVVPESGTDSTVWAALFASQVGVIKALGEAGADLNEGWPHTPLGVAANWGHLELIRALIDGGADVNLANNSGETPLLKAVMEGHKAAVQELLKRGADPNLVPKKKNYDTITNYSPLQCAAMMGKPELVKLLAPAAGARGERDLPAMLLCSAATLGNLLEVKRLVEGEGIDVNARDASHRTPLTEAALGGRASVVKYLIARGADVNLPAGKKSNQNSPLMAAALSGKLNVVQMLVEAGADLDYSIRPFPGGPAYDVLDAAKEERRTKVVQYLLGVQKLRGGGKGGKKKSKARGVTTFETNDAAFLVAAGAGEVSAAYVKLLGPGATRQEDVLGKKVNSPSAATRCSSSPTHRGRS